MKIRIFFIVLFNAVLTLIGCSTETNNYEYIYIYSEPNKTSYFVGEELDVTGLKVCAVTNGFDNEVLEYTINPTKGYILDTVGKKRIYVTYGEKTTFFTISVERVENIALRINDMPKTNYLLGESLDLSNLSVEVIKNNGEIQKIKSFTTIPEDGYILDKTGISTIEVLFEDVSCKFQIEVNEIESDSKIAIINKILTNDCQLLKFYLKEKYILQADYEDYYIKINVKDLSYKDINTDNQLEVPYCILKNGEVIYNGKYNYIFSNNNTGGMLLSFDDYFAVWDNYIDLFSEKKIKATFFCYGWLSRFKSFCKKAQSAGLEVGYHTFHHQNLWEVDTEADVIAEAVTPLETFKDNYLYFYSFAFPNGVYQPYQVELLKQYYRILRLFDNNFRLYTLEEMATSRCFYSQSIDSNKFADSESFREEIFRRLFMSKIVDRVYPCTTHYIGERSDGYNITEDNLIWLLDLVNLMNIKSYLFKDIYTKMY